MFAFMLRCEIARFGEVIKTAPEIMQHSGIARGVAMENSVKKMFSCKCGKSSVFEFASELEIEDVTISASCPSCGANVMITMSAIMKKKAEASAPAANASSESAAPSSSGAVDEDAMKDTESVTYDSVANENVNQAINDLFG